MATGSDELWMQVLKIDSNLSANRKYFIDPETISKAEAEARRYP